MFGSRSVGMCASAACLSMRSCSFLMRSAAGEVVHPQRAAERPGDLRVDQAVAAEHRDEEREHPHEVRRVAQRALALVEGVVDEPDLLLLQVAQAAVHELRRLRRRAAREVVPLDERGAQTPRRGVEGDAAAGDPAADDEDVELLATRGDRARRCGRNRASGQVTRGSLRRLPVAAYGGVASAVGDERGAGRHHRVVEHRGAHHRRERLPRARRRAATAPRAGCSARTR